MNEAETRAEHIDPALKAAGWGVVEGSKILREYQITQGRIEGAGRRGKPLIADYVLQYRNTKLAVGGVLGVKSLFLTINHIHDSFPHGTISPAKPSMSLKHKNSTNSENITSACRTPRSYVEGKWGQIFILDFWKEFGVRRRNPSKSLTS